jgi:hypothetical protein
MTRCALLWGQPSQGKPIQLRAGDDAVHTPHCRPRGKSAWPHQHHQRRSTRTRYGIGWVCTERDAGHRCATRGKHIHFKNSHPRSLNAAAPAQRRIVATNKHPARKPQMSAEAAHPRRSRHHLKHTHRHARPNNLKKLHGKKLQPHSMQCCKLSDTHSGRLEGQSRRSPGGWLAETCGRHALDVTRPRGSPALACH